MIDVPVKDNIGRKYDTFKNKLLSHNQVIGVTVKDSLPTTLSNYTTGVTWAGRSNKKEKIAMETTRVGYDYFNTMNMKMVRGRAFSKEFPSDLQHAFVLNEKAVEIDPNCSLAQNNLKSALEKKEERYKSKKAHEIANKIEE